MSISCAIRNVSNGGLALDVRVPGRYSGSVHIVCRRGKENLFVQWTFVESGSAVSLG
jgi:hypothetical protein